jgi:hypothetical protein
VTSPERMADRDKQATVAVEVRVEPGHHQIGWHGDRGSHAGDGGGGEGGDTRSRRGGQVAGMVWGAGVADVVRMVCGRRCRRRSESK